MGSVTFLTSPFEEERVITLEPQSKATLLSLACQLPWPLHKTCGQGVCGACAVKVVLLDPEPPERLVAISREERIILYQAGKLTDAEYRAPALAARPALWRLACQYVVGDENILVFA
ncbi:MAG: 2Fe-2S iron-sulfur cluster-binding protein [Acidiferrobacter sp.]